MHLPGRHVYSAEQFELGGSWCPKVHCHIMEFNRNSWQKFVVKIPTMFRIILSHEPKPKYGNSGGTQLMRLAHKFASGRKQYFPFHDTILTSDTGKTKERQ